MCPFMATAAILRERRFRPSPATRRFTYSTLAHLYGEICQVCGIGPPLEIDHADGRKETWVVEKLRLLCKPCNSSLQNLPATSVNVREREVQPATEISYESRRSLELGPTFHSELNKLLLAGPLTIRDAENRLAKICACDQQTVRRWVDRETTPEGLYELSSRTVKDRRGTKTLQFISFKAGLEALIPEA